MNNSIIYEKTNPIARGMTIMQHNTANLNFLNDRNVFNQTTNLTEQVDLSAIKPNDYEIGMRLNGVYMRNNKKNLINNPYISEGGSNTALNLYDEPIDDSVSANYSSIISMHQNNKFTLCPIERELIIHEFNEILKNNKNPFGITFDVTTPFGKAFMWKSVILLSKEPYNQQLKLIIGENKDEKLLDMKLTADYFNEQASLVVNIPTTNEVVNVNAIHKLEDIYKIKIILETSNSNVVQIHLKYDFVVKIPSMYLPKETRSQLLGITEGIKTVTLTNVLCSMEQYNNLFNIEIQMGENMVLGFAYTSNRTIIDAVPIEYILSNKPFNYVVNKLIIPKLNKRKTKKNEDMLEKIHLGEICYGKMYKIVMNSQINFELGTCNEEFDVKGKNIGEVIINHPCFYYVKNRFLENKMLVGGLLNY